MTYTNFPDMITSGGVPVMGGIMGLPMSGQWYFVDYASGSDGNTGGAGDPFKTLLWGYTKCVAGNNDVVVIVGDGTTTATARLAATLVWAKNATHLIGMTAPTQVAQRARIATVAATNFTPLVQVTAAGCIFMNFSTFHGYATAETQICWQESGQRNCYINVDFAGMGDATAAAQAGGRSLYIDGGTGNSTTGLGEHTFLNCTIGLDTVTRSAANASLEFAGATPRNTFRNCIFPAMTSSATALFVKAGATGTMDRWQYFQDCAFINAVKSTSTAMTGAFSIGASAGGAILLQRSTILGATDIEATAASGFIYVDGGAPTGTTTALAINNVT